MLVKKWIYDAKLQSVNSVGVYLEMRMNDQGV